MAFIEIQGWMLSPVEDTADNPSTIYINTDKVVMLVPAENTKGGTSPSDIKGRSGVFLEGGVVIVSNETVKGISHKITNGGKEV